MDRSTETPGATGTERRVPLGRIFGVFFRLGLFSFGGGVSGWVYREIVYRRKWVAESDFVSGLALSQLMPGTNIANLSVFVGQRMRGASGAALALLALLTAPFAIVLILLAVYDQISDVPRVMSAMTGVTAAAMGLLLLISGRAAWRLRGDVAGLIAMCATFVMVGVLQWPVLLVVACVAPLSVAAAWRGLDHHAQ